MCRRIAARDQATGRAPKRLLRRVADPQRAQPDDLALAHRDSAFDPRQVLADPDLEQELLERAEPAGLLQAQRPVLHLAQRLDIGREPGQAVGGLLVALEALRVELAARGHQIAHGIGRAGEQRRRGVDRRPGLALRCG